jgi:Rieske Fe-S protein
MYRHFSVRYEASLMVYILSTISWLAMTTAAYYIFVYKIRQMNQPAKKPIKAVEIPKSVPRARPKVVLKKDQTNKK